MGPRLELSVRQAAVRDHSHAAAIGRRQDALRAYERLRSALDEEFAAGPEKATRQLATRIRGEDQGHGG